ncbi:unnamed protein product [Rhizophagus irregularis]|uniref:Uncharacterized protein n=1 Tax=Rhizophagus irregularis TaxID=588596 RepID=A0A915YRB5_9GLOM|nr:unnamed protein product [Rhizophagus irregularis]CAB5320621.1 unnamed protein product [Rhizophagus irregularis]
MKNKNLKDFIRCNNLMKLYISLYLKDKSLNAGSLQEKSQKDGSNILIAEENQLRAEVASLKNKNIKLHEELQQQKKAILINSILRMNSSKMK